MVVIHKYQLGHYIEGNILVLHFVPLLTNIIREAEPKVPGIFFFYIFKASAPTDSSPKILNEIIYIGGHATNVLAEIQRVIVQYNTEKNVSSYFLFFVFFLYIYIFSCDIIC